MEEKKQENLRELLWIIPISVLSVWSVIHTLRSRSFDNILFYSKYTSAITALLFIIIAIFYNSISDRPRTKHTAKDIPGYLMLLGAVLMLGLLYYSVGVFIKDAFLSMQRWLHSPSLLQNRGVISIVSITLILGLILFFIRLRVRTLYGMTEIVVGLVVAAFRYSEYGKNIYSSGFFVAVLTAGVYLVVRGLDNMHQGLTKEPRDYLAVKIGVFWKKYFGDPDEEK